MKQRGNESSAIRLATGLGAALALSGALAAAAVPLAVAGGLTVPTTVRFSEQAVHLVACAPGYPGTTEGAQETMDAFAAMLAEAAGREAGSVTAVYEEEENAGVERIADPGTGLALVPLPFLLKHGDELELRPVLQVVQESGATSEEWSLVAATGHVDDPASLAGRRIEGIPGYAPAFVRGPVLGSWGGLPESVEIVFQPRVLSALRAVASGEDVAVLLDRAQTEALADLPMASELQVVTTSPPLPTALLTTVAGRVPPAALDELVAGLLRVHEEPRFADFLGTLRLARFTEVDEEGLERARSAYRAAAGS